MKRSQHILRHIAPGARGIEVAPWHSPIVAPGGPRDVVVLDVFDRATLLARAAADPSIDDAMTGRIGHVDLVGSACEIAELASARFGAAARFDFVVSSHNFEHLPDPVRFLRGCEALLAAGGVLAMAVPDKRGCFDYFRPLSGIGDILQAFHEQRERPSFAQTFGQAAYTAGLRVGRDTTGAFTVHEDPRRIALLGDVAQSYALWRARAAAGDTAYHDTHCWTFTPSSLELILTELTLLGLITLEIVSVSKPAGCEFYVHLRKRADGAPTRNNPALDDLAPGDLAARRQVLLHRIADELAPPSRLRRTASRPVGLLRRIARNVRQRLRA